MPVQTGETETAEKKDTVVQTNGAMPTSDARCSIYSGSIPDDCSE